jgi:hypothetical protein
MYINIQYTVQYSVLVHPVNFKWAPGDIGHTSHVGHCEYWEHPCKLQVGPCRYRVTPVNFTWAPVDIWYTPVNFMWAPVDIG